MKQFYGDYPAVINTELRPKKAGRGTVLDLFAGCGGLGLGFEAAGFQTVGFEMDSDCCNTYNANLLGRCHEVILSAKYAFPKADVVIGGPPCQPFSVGGHQRGLDDSRDGFPTFISAVDQLSPSLWLFENVRGMLYQNRWYLNQIVKELERLGYIVEFRLLNAIHYLVPQNRERVIVVGHKGGFAFPKKQPYVVSAGDALGELASVVPGDAKFLTPNMDQYVARYERASKCINPRDLNLAKAARTLTCRNLAGATGDMHRIRLADGRRRRLTVGEAARLQSFPDWFSIAGSENSQYTQIGNAVPPMFAYALAASVGEYLDRGERLNDEEIRKTWQRGQASLEFA